MASSQSIRNNHKVIMYTDMVLLWELHILVTTYIFSDLYIQVNTSFSVTVNAFRIWASVISYQYRVLRGAKNAKQVLEQRWLRTHVFNVPSRKHQLTKPLHKELMSVHCKQQHNNGDLIKMLLSSRIKRAKRRPSRAPVRRINVIYYVIKRFSKYSYPIICIQIETVFGSSPSKSPLEEKECIVQRATYGHPLSHTGTRAQLHMDDIAEVLVQAFRINVGKDSLLFHYSGKNPIKTVSYDVSLGNVTLGKVSLKLAEWQELEVSESHLDIGGERLVFPARVLNTGQGLRFEVENKNQGIELRFCENACVHLQTPPSNDLYLIQQVKESRDLWVWARGNDTKATIRLSIKWNQRVSYDFLQFNVTVKETWIPLRVSVSGEKVQLRDMMSDKNITHGLKDIDGGDVFFYFESKKEMYWSFGCGAAGESLMWSIALFTGIVVACAIMVIVISLLIYRRVSSSSLTHPEMESAGFESVFIASTQYPEEDGESRTGRNILADATTPMAPDQDARRKAVRQGGSSEGLQTAHEPRCRTKCPTPVNQPVSPVGTESQVEGRETSGNNTGSSWQRQEEGSVEMNGDENEDRKIEQSRIPRRRNGDQNRRSKRRTAEQGPRTPSHGKKHKPPDGEDAGTNFAPQGPQQALQSARQKKIDRIPSEIIRELSADKSFFLKDSQGTRHGKRDKKEKDISPHRGKAETKALKPSCNGHALAIQGNSLCREHGSGLILHGTGNSAVGHANMGMQGSLPKGAFLQQGPTVAVARGRPGCVHQHPVYIGYYTPTGHRPGHRSVTTLPGNYRKHHRIRQPATDLEIRRVMSHYGINEAAHIAHATPTLTPMPLAIPHQHHPAMKTSPRLVPCYSPIVLSPTVEVARSQNQQF
ncbi:uncharacterized protein LOC134772689 [Penaeus indicus]|uniref:uncharacterized protein LOC134772689 n=1 Tax=Penaeus indicus TaxID=29960 RepID=UPI00300D60BE